MTPQEINLLVTAAANALFEQYTPQELADLSSILYQLANTLSFLLQQAGDTEEASQAQNPGP